MTSRTTMKVFTNENNCIALKLLISGEFAGVSLEVQIVPVEDVRFHAPKKLPVLILDSEETLFSSNIASKYLFPPPKEHYNQVNEWLRWEAIELMPLVTLIGGKLDPSEKIRKLFAHLDSSLRGRKYLIGEPLTVADLAVWSSIFPIATDENLSKQLLSKFSLITSWFSSLEALPQIKAGVDKLKLKRGLRSLEGVVASCWYPIPKLAMKLETESPVSQVIKEDSLSNEDVRAAVEAWEEGLRNGCASKVKAKQREPPILPAEGERNILITSALPYVNNVPHLGNIIGCVLSADVFARYCRLRNWNTLYICGTDEYGTATETKALEEGLTPQQICDKYFAIHSSIYKWFNIEFDHFGRTTTPNQTETVQELFKVCHANGFTSSACMDQLLCEKCDRYLADRFVEGTCPRCRYEDARGDQCDSCGHLINSIDLIGPRCKVCQSAPIVKQSQQLFLDLPKLEGELSKWLDDSKSEDGWTHNAYVITRSWLKDGLKPRCITRDLKWGIPVPLEGYEKKVFYVWFDAPIGYISMTKTYAPGGWLQWWRPTDCEGKKRVELYQFMAKDNVPFHSIMFPATLLASRGDYTLVNHLCATEYLNYEDGKFSKSRGVGVFGNDAKDTGIPSDIFRFYLLFIRPEAQDSSFSWADLAIKNNTELLNNLGNFALRALMFTEKFFNSHIMPITLGPEERQLLTLVNYELHQYNSSLSRVKLRDGMRYILNISRHGNGYMQSNQPWVLVKGSEVDSARAGTVVSFCCNMVALLTILLQPYMPETSNKLVKQINFPMDQMIITEDFIPILPPGHKIGKSSPLFTKIEQSVTDELKQRYSGVQQTVAKPEQQKGSRKPVAGEQSKSSPFVAGSNGDSPSVALLEAAIVKQGDKVRLLKSSGVEKSVWQPQVDVLLNLKKELATVKGVPTETTTNSSGKKSKNKK